MKIQQISLFAENKPGHLTTPLQLLAAAGINIRALYLADSGEYGILRLIVTDWQRAFALLDDKGYAVKVTEVLAVEVPDCPGGMATVLNALDGAVNIDYMYAFPYLREGQAVLLFRFSDPDAAIERLQGAGINVLASSELLA